VAELDAVRLEGGGRVEGERDCVGVGGGGRRGSSIGAGSVHGRPPSLLALMSGLAATA